MKLPELLDDGRRADALEVVACYYGCGRHEKHRGAFTGSRFDTWDSLGTRRSDVDRFTADDLVALTFLSVNVPARAAIELLETRESEFSNLLRSVGPDRDLVEETNQWEDDWPGWKLWAALDSLPGVGPTIASKLYARKRPRLRPIYDTVVERVIESKRLWEPLRAHFQQDPGLHGRLVDLRDELRLSEETSAVRIFDVLAWMEGKGYVKCQWP